VYVFWHDILKMGYPLHNRKIEYIKEERFE